MFETTFELGHAHVRGPTLFLCLFTLSYDPTADPNDPRQEAWCEYNPVRDPNTLFPILMVSY